MVSSKERIWLEEYLKCWNASEAARRAGYRWPKNIGSRKLAKFAPEIKARLAKQVMSADEALARMAELARGGWTEYITLDGGLDIARMVSDDKAYLIAEIRDTIQSGRVYKFPNMQRALEKIGDQHGLFVTRHRVDGKIDIGLADAAREFDKHIARLIAARGAPADSEGPGSGDNQ